MQQPETTLIYWAPSRVRFNLTLILAAVVVALGLIQAAGYDPISAVCSPPQSSQTADQSDGGQAAGGEASPPAQTSRGSAFLLIIVGLGVGAYSWLTSPRQYRVYSDALVIMFGMPRRRTIHFSDVREVVLDRGFMGDPLRVYTTNRRRVPLQVREPEEMHRYLDSATKDFWRDNPQYAPPPSEDGDDDRAADVVDSTAADGDAGEPSAQSADSGEAPQRSPRSRRRSLRDDDETDAAESGDGDGSSGGGSGETDTPQRSPRSRRRSLRDDSGGNADTDAGSTDRPPRFS